MEPITAYISGEGWYQMVYADEAQTEINSQKAQNDLLNDSVYARTVENAKLQAEIDRLKADLFEAKREYLQRQEWSAKQTEKVINELQAKIDDKQVKEVRTDQAIKDAVISNHIVDYPEDWHQDSLLDALSSDEFYSHPDVTVHEYFEDWNTRELSRHMRDIIRTVEDALYENNNSG